MPLGSKICCQNHLHHIQTDLLFMRRQENELKDWARGEIGNCCCCSFQSAFPDPPTSLFQAKKATSGSRTFFIFHFVFCFPPSLCFWATSLCDWAPSSRISHFWGPVVHLGFSCSRSRKIYPVSRARKLFKKSQFWFCCYCARFVGFNFHGFGLLANLQSVSITRPSIVMGVVTEIGLPMS